MINKNVFPYPILRHSFEGIWVFHFLHFNWQHIEYLLRDHCKAIQICRDNCRKKNYILLRACNSKIVPSLLTSNQTSGNEVCQFRQQERDNLSGGGGFCYHHKNGGCMKQQRESRTLQVSDAKQYTKNFTPFLA